MVHALVVGAKGFIGSHFLRALGPDAIGTHHAPSMGLALVDLEAPQWNTPCSFAIIAGGVGNPRACEQDRERSYRCNVAGPLLLCEQLLEFGARPVLFSTDYVFDGTSAPYSVEALPSPLNIYGAHKAELERRAPKEALVIRLSKVYGPLFEEMAHSLLDSRLLRVAHDQIFAPIHIDDVVSHALNLVAEGATGLYNFCGPLEASRLEMAQKVAAFLNLRDAKITPISLEELNDGVVRPKHTTLVPSVRARPFDEVLCQQLKKRYGTRRALSCPSAL